MDGLSPSASPPAFGCAPVASKSSLLRVPVPGRLPPAWTGALVKAVVRTHRWRQMIESGKYASSAELARAKKVNDSYLSRILRVTLLAPDIIEAILTGCQPSTLQLDELLKPLSAEWNGQRSKLGIR